MKGFSKRNILCMRNRSPNKNKPRVNVTVGVGVVFGVNKPTKSINVTCANGIQTTCNEHQLGCNDTSNYGPCSPESLTCNKPFPTGPVEINIDNKISQGFAARVENDLYVRFPNYCGLGKPNTIPMITQRQFQIQANEGLRSDSLPYDYLSPPKPQHPSSNFVNRSVREVDNRALRVLNQRTRMNRYRNNIN